MLSTKLAEADVNPHFLFLIRMSNLDPSKQGPAGSKPDILVIEAQFDNLPKRLIKIPVPVNLDTSKIKNISHYMGPKTMTYTMNQSIARSLFLRSKIRSRSLCQNVI